MIRPVHCWKRTDVSIIPIVGAIALELIEAGWNSSIPKPRRLESRPYTAGALTYSSSGETSLDSRVRGDHQSRGRAGCAGMRQLSAGV